MQLGQQGIAVSRSPKALAALPALADLKPHPGLSSFLLAVGFRTLPRRVALTICTITTKRSGGSTAATMTLIRIASKGFFTSGSTVCFRKPSPACPVASAQVNAAILIRPTSLAEIQRTAREGLLMPPKSTFFTPKLRTGLVIRPTAAL